LCLDDWCADDWRNNRPGRVDWCALNMLGSSTNAITNSPWNCRITFRRTQMEWNGHRLTIAGSARAKEKKKRNARTYRYGVGGNRARRVDADTTAPWTHSLPSPFLARFLLLLLLGRGKETRKLTKTEQERFSANRRPKNWQRPSVLSSHYRVSVSLQGVHYL
jgi:hypothetical protein